MTDVPVSHAKSCNQTEGAGAAGAKHGPCLHVGNTSSSGKAALTTTRPVLDHLEFTTTLVAFKIVPLELLQGVLSIWISSKKTERHAQAWLLRARERQAGARR